MVGTGLSRKVVLVGGAGATGANDQWSWDGNDWTPLATATRPSHREWLELVYDSQRDVCVLFDDFSSPVVTNHWELTVPVQHPGTVSTIGSGCPSSAGVPTLAAAPGSLPFVGHGFELRMTGVPSSIFSPAFLMTGYSTTQWSGRPLPWALGSYGMPGCTAWVAAEATDLMSGLGGVATKAWNIPVSTSFVGVEFHAQGAVLDPGLNAAGFAVSNGVTVHVGQL